jgi:hypothetical protein
MDWTAISILPMFLMIKVHHLDRNEQQSKKSL